MSSDGSILNPAQAPPISSSSQSVSHEAIVPSSVAMATDSGSGQAGGTGEGRLAVSFVTKISIAGDGKCSRSY